MVKLYTTNCPKCRVLETKLKQKKIDFETITDISVIQEKGFMEAPILEIDEIFYPFSEAVKWVNGH